MRDILYKMGCHYVQDETCMKILSKDANFVAMYSYASLLHLQLPLALNMHQWELITRQRNLPLDSVLPLVTDPL